MNTENKSTKPSKPSKPSKPKLREVKSKMHDIFIIGGGINGVGIARDAVGRGYSVCLAEADDLASGTSSQSTKLIHGGLRYLEHYEFKLVREALTEREVLWRVAPHIIHPMRFILPHHKGLRPWWLLRLGLFMYDHLGGRKLLPATNSIDLIDNPEGDCLKQNFRKGFEYSDCWVNDSRLVVLNAMDAREYGATIKTQSKCIAVERFADCWSVTLENQLTKETEIVTAKVLINAAGPWVDDIINIVKPDAKTPAKNIRKVQGSHIVVPKLYDHDKCYIFQNEDDRITFAIPYHEDYTYLGTTDYEIDGDPRDAKISQGEIEYLCEAANDYFKTEITPDDVVSTYAGVRALYNDGDSSGGKKAQEATRDYILQIDEDSESKAPLVNIFGGKITTYRKLAESMMDIVNDLLGKDKSSWTENAHLPGGDFRIEDKEKLHQLFKQDYGFLPQDVITRLLRNYGSKAALILGKADSEADLGKNFGHGLYQKEVEHLIENEFALKVDDILLRRTKLGLKFNKKERKALETWLNKYFS